ncbi:MAG: DNA polymerase I [Streptomycetales bacterium]
MADSSGPHHSARHTGRPRLLLLDGHSLAYRAFFARPVENFATTTGQPTNAVYGFTSMLINTLRDEQPTHIAVAFDASRKTFRSEAYAEYKAKRLETPVDFKGQISLICDVLDALRIPSIQLEGYEADDVIATLATQAEREGYDVLILTGDRDCLQLVTGQVTVLYPRRGVSELTRFTPDAVQDKYGLTPAQYPDFAALRGDPSDNLPGIPGVGEKTAAKWVREFGSLDALVDRVDEVRGKAGQALRDHLAGVMRNRQLTELVRSVTLEVTPDGLHHTQWDREAVHAVFDALEFRVLRDRLYQTLQTAQPEADTGFEVDGRVLDPGDLPEWLAEHAPPGGRLGVAAQGHWGRGTGVLSGLALSAPDGSAVWLDPTQLTEQDATAFAAWACDAARPKTFHDAKGPQLALAAHGWELRGVTSDTALCAYLVLPGQRTFDLADLSLRFLRRELRVEAPEDGQLSLDGGDEYEAATVLMVRAHATLELSAVLDRELDSRGGAGLLRDVELPLVTVLADMERAGIGADRHYLSDLEAQFAAHVKQVTEEAHRVAGREFNLGSPKQLQQILFDELKLPKTKRIKTGYTTDADALQWLALQTDNELPVVLLRHRDVSRLRVTVEGLLKAIADDGRIHTTYNQMVAATGRLSSVDPNLQNIPIRTDEGRRIRRAFVVGEGYDCLLTADYSQIEMRIMAHLSEDAGLLDAFHSGMDFHAVTAARVFAVPAEQVTPEMRRRIKAMNYGLAYGLSAFGLAQQLGITPEEARALMEEYFDRFGGVRDYLRDVVERARREGYTETMLGRRRYLPDLTSDNRQRREMAERMALNAPIQGSAADIIKVAMLGVDRALREEGMGSRLLLQVHDELVLEVTGGERESVEALVRREMGSAYPLRAPLDVSIGVGPTWEDAGH